MAVKIKETDNHTRYEPRFDFQECPTSNKDQTATIKELLVELNRQRADQSIADYNLKSLGTTLRLVSSISGIKIPRRIDQAFPLPWMKTVKLLFTCNQFIDAHLIRMIEPPGLHTPASIDFFTSPATPESDAVKRAISRMISMLEKEIGRAEIDAIAEICSPTGLRELYLQDTNEAVYKIILTHIHVDDELFEHADAYLADQTRTFLTLTAKLKREPRLHVATYTYLKLLTYVHRLHFELSMQFSIPNDMDVANKCVDFTKICNLLSVSENRPIVASTNFMSVMAADVFASVHQADIAKLVSQATGFDYNKRDVESDRSRASAALQLYLYKAGLLNEEAKSPVGVVHVVAAYCSVLHQRKMKTKPAKKSRKYGLKLSSPQKQLDSFIANPKTHLPQTTQYIYGERTYWYVQALLGRRHKAKAHAPFQIAQAEWQRDVFLSLDHMQIRTQIAAYREFMTRAARDFVALHNRQATFYQWRQGD